MDQEVINFLARCMLCGNSPNKRLPSYVDIFSPSGVSQKLMDKIERHLPVVKVEEGMPQKVCQKCIDTMNIWNSFEADFRKAREMLYQIKPKPVEIKTEQQDSEDQNNCQPSEAVFIQETDTIMEDTTFLNQETDIVMEEPKIESINEEIDIKFEPDSVAQDIDPQCSVAQDSVAQDSVAQDSVAQDSVAQDSVAQDSVAQDSVAQDSVAQDSAIQDPMEQDTVSLNTQDSVAHNTVAQNTLPWNYFTQNTMAQNSVTQSTVEEPEEIIIERFMTNRTDQKASRNAPDMDYVRCAVCKFFFSNEDLVEHMMIRHDTFQSPDVSSTSVDSNQRAEFACCDICNQKIPSKYLWDHLKIIHRLGWLKKQGDNVKCPLCPLEVPVQVIFSHLRVCHKFQSKSGVLDLQKLASPALENVAQKNVQEQQNDASKITMIEPQVTSIGPQAMSEPQTTAVEPQVTMIEPLATTIEPQTTNKPQATMIEPQTTAVEPQATMSEPQITIEPQTTTNKPQATVIEPQAMSEPQTTTIEPQAMREPHATMSEPQIMIEPQATMSEPQATMSEPHVTMSEAQITIESQTTMNKPQATTNPYAPKTTIIVISRSKSVPPPNGPPFHKTPTISYTPSQTPNNGTPPNTVPNSIPIRRVTLITRSNTVSPKNRIIQKLLLSNSTYQLAPYTVLPNNGIPPNKIAIPPCIKKTPKVNIPYIIASPNSVVPPTISEPPGFIQTYKNDDIAPHNGEYQCDKCNAVFRNPHHLVIHKDIWHSKNPNYHCNVCDNWYTSLNKLMQHKQEKHPIIKRPFSIIGLFCERNTNQQKKVLGLHYKSVQCGICKLKCNNKFLLMHHIKDKHLLNVTINKTAPFDGLRCKVCNKGPYKTETSFMLHNMMNHVPKLTCHFCGAKEFRRTLIYHMKKHHKEIFIPIKKVNKRKS